LQVVITFVYYFMTLRRFILFAFLTIALFGAARPIAAKDEWIQIRSKNFFLIGNASEKDIRKVGTRLEQFRESFRLLFNNTNLASPIPTNVVVFKSDSSYKPFKPKRADGKIDTFVAGYFQSGEDVNYITLSTEGEDAQTYETIFHEYVHFIVDTSFGKSEVPAWFNEGLAEYYSTFEIEGDQKIKLGLPQSNHLALLQQNKLMPLDTLFGISNRQLLESGGHSRNIFYAQSWALIHYLMQSGKGETLGKFLGLLIKNVSPEKAFQDAFQTNYQQMEKDLRKYVGKSSYQYNIFVLKNKLAFDAEMQASPLDEAETNAYLGDLLYHNNRPDDAEPYLVKSLKLNSDSSMANTALGMIKVKQRKFDDARIYLEKAISKDPKNHNAFYRYAYLLSREGQDEFGFVQRFSDATAAKMREALRKAISLNPTFAESYELLAFVALVNNDELDDAVAQLKTALKLQPGNQRYALRIAEIYSRQNKHAEATAIAEKIARTTDDPETKDRAEKILANIAELKEFEERRDAERKRYEAAVAASGGGKPMIVRRIEGVKQPTEAEMVKLQEEARLRAINEALRVPAEGERREIGRVQKIDCKARPIVYTIKTATETFTVTSKDFYALTLSSLDPDATNAQVGCDANLSAFNVLITYRAMTVPKSTARGELVAIEFVPAGFRLMTDEEMRSATLVIYDQPDTDGQPPPARTPTSMPTAEDIDARRREMILQAMKNALRKPADGEKRAVGYLQALECSNKKIFFQMRTATGIVKLFNSSPESVKIMFFTPDLAGMQLGCGMKPVEYPAVFIYTDKPDAKTKAAGEIVSLEFMPKSFVLEP